MSNRFADQKQSMIYVNVAVLLFGLAGLFAKWVGIPAIGITFGRVVFSAAALLIYQLVRRQSLKLHAARDAYLLIIAGVILALHWWSFFTSIQISTVAIGTITFSSFPLFVVFLEPIIFQQQLKIRNIVMAVLIVIGVFITIPEISPENTQFQGIMIGMVSALAYAVLTLFNKKFSESYSGTQVAFYEQTVAAIVLLPFVLRIHMEPSAKDIFMIAFLGVLMTAVAHTLFISSLRNLSARFAGICSSMETVYGILLAFLILQEIPSRREIVGAAVVVGVVIWSHLYQVDDGMES